MDSKQKHRIVFLIDTSLASCEKCNHYNEILTSAIRLLSLFSGSRYQSQINSNENRNVQTPKAKLFKDTATNRTDRSTSNSQIHLSWGFKFFNTNLGLPRTKSDKGSCYNDVNNGVFEHFEKRLKQMLDPALVSAAKRKSMSHPSDYLMNALRDILHEFEWQDQDSGVMVSKLKGLHSSRRSREMDFETTSVKHVFLFAQVPSSKQCLRRFCNKVVLDSDVFVESVMSPTLFEEYKDKQKIKISWIDLTSPDCDSRVCLQNTYHQSIGIVRGAMNQLGGTLLPKDYLIHRIPTLVDPVNLKESDYFLYPKGLNLFPIESVLPALLSSVSKSTESAMQVSCPLTLAGTCAVTSLKLLPLQSTRNTNGERDFQKLKGNSSVPEARVFDLQKSTCDIIDFTHMEMELVGFVMPGAISKSLSSVDILASYLLTCDKNNLLLKSLLDHMLSNHMYGLLKVRLKSHSKGQLRFAVMSSSAVDVGFVSVLTTKACVKLEDVKLRQGDVREKVKSKPASYNIYFSELARQFQQRLNEGKSETGEQVQINPLKLSEIFDAQNLNSWHVPGSSHHIDTVMSKLNDCLTDEGSSSEKDILRKLKKAYLKEKQPYQLFSQPSSTTTTPVNDTGSGKMDVSGSSESDRRSSLDTSLRRSGSLSRGRLMVDKARSASMSFFDDSEGSLSSKQGNSSRRASDSSGFTELNLTTDASLSEYLSKQYNQILGAGVAMEVAIQAMVTVACRFMANKQMSNPQKSAVSFVKKYLVVDILKLREKYDKTKFDVKKSLDVTEYKLQVILLLEIESLVSESDRSCQDKIVTDLVSLLRPLSFASGVPELRSFLESLTTSYSRSLSLILMDVHDELDQPYPAALAKFASPSAPSSAWGPSLSVMSDSLLSGPGSSQPASNQLSQQTKRSSRLKQHPSFADFGQKKQILVNKIETKAKAKTGEGKKTKDKGKQKLKSHRTRYEVDCDQAKRNLFSDNAKATPRKRKDKRSTTPQRRREKSKLLVPGTPAHKQTSKRILRRQQKLREHFNIKPVIQVVAESPVKDDGKHVDNRPARMIVRQSFYSTNSGQSRNVAKSLEQPMDETREKVKAENLFCRSRSRGSLASAVRGESPILSPRSRIIKSFCTSPSSCEKSDGTPRSRSQLRRSPRKSAKKLIFHESFKDFENDRATKKEETSNPRLIFDGDNASDIQLGGRVPSTSSSALNEGFKTPEKNSRTGDIHHRANTSIPHFSMVSLDSHAGGKSKELNFKNAFSSQRSSLSEIKVSNAPSSSPSSRNGTSSPNRSNMNVDQQLNFSSPDQAAKLRSSFLLSPKRKSPVKLGANFHPVIHPTAGPSSSTISSFKSPTKTRHFIMSPSRKRQQSVDEEDDEHDHIVYCTPKKASHGPRHVHSTPSKVTFSESCLVSPPQGPSDPSSAQKMTPKKSILKNSPAFKVNLTDKILKAGLQSQPEKKVVPLLNIGSDKSSSTPKKRKHKDISEGREAFAGSSSRGFNPEGESRLSNAENLPSISSIKKRILSFDTTVSSSSNECSNNAPSNGVGVTTVVTVHTPSPTKKCKTPDVNNWMRKKRHSGSRNCSSSSSSPSLFSSSPSSSEAKNKGSETKNGGSAGNSNSIVVTREAGDSVCHKDRHCTETDVSNEEQTAVTGKCLKRNLFSVADAQTLSTRSSFRKDISENLMQSSNSKARKKSTETCKRDSSGQKERNTLPSNLSGGFHPISGSLPAPEEEEPLPTSMSINKQTKTRLSLLCLEEEEKKPSDAFKSKLSSPRFPSLSSRTSSFAIDGSQGFQLMLPTSPSAEQSQEGRMGDSKPHHASSINPELGSILFKEAPRGGEQQSPNPSSIGKAPTEKFSPALSTSGLLQLIKSPLLDSGAKRNDIMARKETRGKGKGKSRKHLNLI